MKEQDKKRILEDYKKAKENGVPFYPDILFKDAVVALIVFLVLVGLAYFLGAPLEERANPADASYTPRPEWYFLFLFQLLKYFPGNLEVIGVILIPGIVIILLALLPLLDNNPRRHFLDRPWVTGITSVLVVGILALTVLSYLEAPPPAEQKTGDTVAQLYTEHCSPCHGPRITVPDGLDLHTIIAQGTHGGMPAWNGDLSTDEIDALAGFITSPSGYDLYRELCLECHEIPDLVATNPIELRDALEQGKEYPPHADLEIPYGDPGLSGAEVNSLLNFLVAPDGQRLFAINCSSCHGESVAFNGSQSELRTVISEGGQHLEMPSWQGSLSEEQLDSLANYVVDPEANPQSAALFEENCSSCHGSRIPESPDFETAREVIASGGSHQTMPIWGETLTNAQLDALTAYTWDASQGTSLEEGQDLYTTYCSACHGIFGEGGQNPSRAGDIIPPISSSEYLSTRDNNTLYNIISQGQPNIGMSPFGSEYGGPLNEDQINAIVAYIRSWEANPPVELPPEVQQIQTIELSGQQVYDQVCSQCHQIGQDALGPDLSNPDFQASTSDDRILDSIKNGHPSTAMIAFSGLLTEAQMEDLITVIRDLEPQPEETAGTEETAETGSGVPSFANDIRPILEEDCAICHGSLGGWDASSYESVINSGDNGPVVIPGDPDNSLLAQKLLDTQEIGGVMPPGGKLPESIIQLFIDWIAAGAPDN